MFIEILPFVSAQVPSGASLGTSAFKIGYQILFAFVAIVGIAILFFGSRALFSGVKKYRNYKINAVIFNPDGTWYTSRIGKFRTKDNIDKMLFQGSSETMPVIDPKYIRANKVCLWRYGVGQYAVIPPKIWEGMDPKKWKIDVINMQMKNFSFLEQRAAVSRWTYIKDLLNRWGPYMTMLILGITAGVITWFLMKLGYNIFNDAITARTIECKELIGASVPTAAG